MVWVAAKRTVTEGPHVLIDCPACQARQTPSIPRHFEEPLLLLHLIPLFTLRSTFIHCGACGQSLAVACNFDEVYRLSGPELSGRLRPYVSGVGRFLVVSALLLFWFPFLAPLLAMGGLFMTRRHPRWRRLAIVAVVLSVLVAIAVLAILLFTHDSRGANGDVGSMNRSRDIA